MSHQSEILPVLNSRSSSSAARRDPAREGSSTQRPFPSPQLLPVPSHRVPTLPLGPAVPFVTDRALNGTIACAPPSSPSLTLSHPPASLPSSSPPRSQPPSPFPPLPSRPPRGPLPPPTPGIPAAPRNKATLVCVSVSTRPRGGPPGRPGWAWPGRGGRRAAALCAGGGGAGPAAAGTERPGAEGTARAPRLPRHRCGPGWAPELLLGRRG